MWQALYDELRDEGFIIVAVAQDVRGADAARPWIERAQCTYPTLIDQTHRVSEIFGMVNVPEAVWIDERGRIARPAESAGATDHFRRMDRATMTLAQEDADARTAARGRYYDAVRAWVRTGSHTADPETAARKTKTASFSPAAATAHAHFKLGTWLCAHGRATEAQRHFDEASRLHPDSWCIWRQAADLDRVGGAAGPEFWARVDALGDRPYYPPPDLPGFGPRELRLGAARVCQPRADGPVAEP